MGTPYEQLGMLLHIGMHAHEINYMQYGWVWECMYDVMSLDALLTQSVVFNLFSSNVL